MTKRIVTTLQQFSIPLIVGVIAAVLWANVSPSSYASFVHWSPGDLGPVNVHFMVNDIFMVFFFAIATGEIVEACLPGGALNPPRKAVNPLFATVGGVVGPVAVYLAWVSISGDSSIQNGWGIPTATDIALAWLVARTIFGKSHPAVSFLVLLAVADDGIGLAIIAIAYPDPSNPVRPELLLLVATAMSMAYLLRRNKVNSILAYLVGPGVLSWCGLYFAGLHPALALVAIVPFMPAASHDDGLFAEKEADASDTLNRFQHNCTLPVDFGLLLFGLANAGVVMSSVGSATWAVLAALVVGKTAGIFGASMLATRIGFGLPEGMNTGDLLLVGFSAALGLTVALFVAGVAFTDPSSAGAAKMGALLSAGVAPVAILAGRLRQRRARAAAEKAATVVASPAPKGSALHPC